MEQEKFDSVAIHILDINRYLEVSTKMQLKLRRCPFCLYQMIVYTLKTTINF